jgi:CheY-like chemotaxis protein
MPDLGGLAVLVVEDEPLAAEGFRQVLQEFGARVLGPVGHLHEALVVLEHADGLDGAVLDLNLHGEAVYPLADALTARGVPYVFVTGYAPAAAIPTRYNDVPRYEMPVEFGLVVQALALHILERSSLKGDGSLEGV